MIILILKDLVSITTTTLEVVLIREVTKIKIHLLECKEEEWVVVVWAVAEWEEVVASKTNR